MTTEATPAGLGRRLAARVVDGLLPTPIVVAAIAADRLLDGVVGMLLALLLLLLTGGFALYNQVVLVGRRGSSLGKGWLSVRVVARATGQPVGVGQALARELVLGLLAGACLVPALVNLVVTAMDARRQGWHDKAAGAWVLPGTTAGEGGDPGERRAEPPSSDTVSSDTLSSDTVASRPTAYDPSTPPSSQVQAPPAPAPGTTGVVETPAPMVAPPPGVSPPPGPAAETDPTPETVEDPWPVEQTVMRPVAASTPEPAAGAPEDRDAADPRWRLTAPDGTQRVIEGLVLVGRDPDPALVTGAEVWSVEDPRLSMSKTHALLGIEDGVAWVEDWASTNGVALHRGEAQLVIEPHARTPLRDGDLIEFGACRVSVEVTR